MQCAYIVAYIGLLDVEVVEQSEEMRPIARIVDKRSYC